MCITIQHTGQGQNSPTGMSPTHNVNIVTRLLFTGMLFVHSLLQAEDRVTSIDLGGPRKVVAQITPDADDLIIAVELLAVRSFDQATNKHLNRRKAETYAHEALAGYLFPKVRNRVTVVLSGVTVDNATLKGQRFRLTLRVPRSGISEKEIVKRVEKMGKSNKDIAARDAGEVERKVVKEGHSRINLFEVKADYAETLRLLTDTYLTAIPALPAKLSDDPPDTFFMAIADLEEQAERSFDALIAEMRKDKLLLSIELDELIQQVEKERTELMDLLRKAVQAATSTQSAP